MLLRGVKALGSSAFVHLLKSGGVPDSVLRSCEKKQINRHLLCLLLLLLQLSLQAVAADDFKQVMRQEDLDAAVMRAAAGDRLLLLMAGTTWCSASRAIVQQIKVGNTGFMMFVKALFSRRVCKRLLMAGTTWCAASRAIVQQIKVGNMNARCLRHSKHARTYVEDQRTQIACLKVKLMMQCQHGRRAADQECDCDFHLLLLQALACAYPSLDVVMLWGNMNATTKELFRDQLLVSRAAMQAISKTILD